MAFHQTPKAPRPLVSGELFVRGNRKMQYITRLRRRLERIRKDQQSNALWYLCGLATLPAFGVLSSLFLKIPGKVLGVLVPLLFLLLLILSTWIILLKDKLNICQKYLKQFAPPGFNPDNQEEYSEIRNEVLEEDEFKDWK